MTEEMYALMGMSVSVRWRSSTRKSASQQSCYAVAVAAYGRVRQAFAIKAMRAGLAPGNTAEYFPGVDVSTDAQILDTIRNTLHTVWHASCTCVMGRTNDPNAVVDTKTNVIGVTG